VYWSPSTRTALAEAELEYSDNHASPSVFVALRMHAAPLLAAALLPAAGHSAAAVLAGLHAAVWTTTPWTLPANRARGSVAGGRCADARRRRWRTTPRWRTWSCMRPAVRLAAGMCSWRASDWRSLSGAGAPWPSSPSCPVRPVPLCVGGAVQEGLTEGAGAALAGSHCDHPLVEMASPLIAGGHVTADAGTGLVHTAPGVWWSVRE
jgi:isoleucyl-tRNA synthetase